MAAIIAATLVTLGLYVPPAAAAAVRRTPPPTPSAGRSVRGVYPLRAHFVRPHDPTTPFRATRTSFPAAARASVSLPLPAGTGVPAARAQAAGTPVWAQAIAGAGGYGGPARVDVRVLDHAAATAAGVTGVVLSVTPAGTGSGRVRLGVDYRGFAQAYGGNFGSRLRLVRLPACALTTPSVPSCRTQTPLVSSNDFNTATVSAMVSLRGPPAAPHGALATESGQAATGSASTMVVLAATTSTDPGVEGGSTGNYAATTLSPSGTWDVDTSSGSFTYSYPIAPPVAVSSMVPPLSLEYDSSSVDGQTSATQAQASWAGDGWSTLQGFVEQSFVSCSDNPEGSASPVSTYDHCYNGPILTMSLNGMATSLVWDSTRKVWKSQRDDGSVVTHLTGTNNGTGTYNTDYWTVTRRDGTVYEFGRNELPGWVSGKPTTNSVDSVPVYSAHSGDPCYNSAGFTSSVCTMAYRWNLDYVKDAHGNAMAYYYKQDTNYYGEDNGAHMVSYVRDSHLDHIDYGFSDPNAYASVGDKVVFATGDRCVSGTCDPLNSTTAANWPDVPYDLVCAAGATCNSWAPSFFSTVRLTSITTEQYSTASAAYVAVDSYALAETIPATGDGTPATLWLSSITRTGSDTTAGGSTSSITLPSVSFTPTAAMANRVDDVTDGLPPLDRYRIQAVTTETGSVISPTYSLVNACSAPVTLTPATNTSSCYPVYWTPQGYTAPFLDWFNKYVVTKVTQTDPTGGAPAVATSYTYNGGAGWHYDDNEVVQAKYRTYGQYRGYGDVQTRSGDGVNDPQTLSETTYYRGMSDDNNTTAVMVTDSAGGQHEDINQLAGQALESTAYLGDGGGVDHSTISSYWVSTATATRSRSGLPALTANTVAPAETYTRQVVTTGGSTSWRYTEVDNTYDATTSDATFGELTHTYTHTVPADSAYDRCTSTSYAPVNAGANLVGLPAETETDSVACGNFTEGSTPSVPSGLNTLTAPASVSRPAQVVAETRSFYDDPTFSTTFPQTTAPTKGDVTMTEKAVDYASGAFVFVPTVRSTYDSVGRVTASYDGNGNKTSTSYTTNAYGETTAVAMTNALNQSTSMTLDPERGLTLTGSDLNGVVTTNQYDALGRTTAVWLAGRATSTSANYLFSYTVSNTGITAATTQRLNNASTYLVSTQIYDALLRPRQTQAPTPQLGRLVTDTFYDSHGWVSARYNGWWDSTTTPNTTLVSAANLKDAVPSQDFYTRDGLGRVVIDDSDNNGQLVSSTTTVYNGDRTTTIPPAGGITQASVVDPIGRTSGINQYTSAPTLITPANTFTGTFYLTGGTTSTTSYGYDGHGRQNSITDAAGATWTTSFDLLGRAKTKTDPDAGTTNMVYDNNGNLTQTTDARGKTTSLTYDPLDRKTGLYDAPTSGQSTANQMAAWVYDNSNNAVSGMSRPLGQLTTETSYSGGGAYTTQYKGFTAFGDPTGETISIPAATEGSVLGTSYTFSHVYNSVDGLLVKDSYPAAGGLPSETVNYNYDGLDQINTVGGLDGYANKTDRDAYDRINQESIGASPNLADITYSYDQHTGWLTDELLTRQVATPSNVDDQAYTYDPAGNITKQVSTRLGASTPTETQCYTYDSLNHLTQAWTATDSCASTPTTTNHSMVGDSLGAASAYWSTWTVNTIGQRTQQIQHDTSGVSSDTTTSYTYNGNNTNQPHTLTGTASTGGTTATTSYGYDAAGNMTTRTTPAHGAQTLTYNDANQLTSITSPSGTTSYVYDADGNVLLQKDPGTTILYLPGEQISLNTTTNTTTGVRYYPLPGNVAAVRTGSGTAYNFEINDQHNTPTIYLDYTAQTPTWRQYTPYGDTRGTASTPPDNRGFLNKPLNTNTGLTQLGARQYDPTTATFTTVDPLLETTSPQQLAGYNYAANNPNTNADPTGLSLPIDTGGGGGGNGTGCTSDNSCSVDLGTTGDYGSGGGGSGSGCTSDNSCSVDLGTTGDYGTPAKKADQGKNGDGKAEKESAFKQWVRKIVDLSEFVNRWLGFVPGWICSFCETVSMILHVVTILGYAYLREWGHMAAAAVSMLGDFVMGKGGEAIVDKMLEKEGAEAMRWVSHGIGTGRHGIEGRVLRYVPTRAKQELDYVMSASKQFISNILDALVNEPSAKSIDGETAG